MIRAAAVLLALACLGLAPPAEAGASARSPKGHSHARHAPPRLHGNAGRAEDAYLAMQRIFYLPVNGLYRGAPYSYLWSFSQALVATDSISAVPGAPRAYRREAAARLSSLGAYWDPNSTPPGYDGEVAPPRGRGGDKYYDDNEWLGLELIRLYRHAHYEPFLVRARQLLGLVESAWDPRPQDACPGGVPFSNDRRNDQRNVVTTAPGAQLAAQLYVITRDPTALTWARRMYDWVRACLSQQVGGAATGLYVDHLRWGGQLDPTVWSYNQGSMIGAGVMLWQATGQRSYLDQARATAAAALAYFTPARLHREPPFFVSVFARNLLALDSVATDAAYRALVQGYVDWAWQRHRNRHTGVYSFAAPGAELLLDQAALVNLYAYLASPASTLF